MDIRIHRHVAVTVPPSAHRMTTVADQVVTVTVVRIAHRRDVDDPLGTL
jgi:hypothetical protein